MEVSALTQKSMPGLAGPSALLRLQSDERLIALTRRGQHAAFEVLFGRYQSRLLAFCRHMLGSKEDAEDVLQEVFAAAFNAVLADEREINVRPWLYRIARNRSLNHLRKATAIGVDSMDVHYAENGQSTGERVMKRESFRQLLGDVKDLPETQRTALLLREIDALSYEQIASAMETTVPSVKSLLVRARISLAEAAESRELSCETVRCELGEVAEGLAKLSAPARRHVRGCERCRSFKKHLHENNKALAAIFPVGPLFLARKLLLTKLGSTASAGHVSAGATAGAGASASAGAGAGATASAGAGGGLLTAGASAVATKAVAGLAAAAIVTAVATQHAGPVHHHPAVLGASATAGRAVEPVIVHTVVQPLSTGRRLGAGQGGRPPKGRRGPAGKQPKAGARLASQQQTATAITAPGAQPPNATTAKPVVAAPVTEVTTETTTLPASATSAAQPGATVSAPAAVGSAGGTPPPAEGQPESVASAPAATDTTAEPETAPAETGATTASASESATPASGSGTTAGSQPASSGADPDQLSSADGSSETEQTAQGQAGTQPQD